MISLIFEDEKWAEYASTSIGIANPREYIERVSAPVRVFPSKATIVRIEAKIGPTQGIQSTPRESPSKKPEIGPSLFIPPRRGNFENELNKLRSKSNAKPIIRIKISARIFNWPI